MVVICDRSTVGGIYIYIYIYNLEKSIREFEKFFKIFLSCENCGITAAGERHGWWSEAASGGWSAEEGGEEDESSAGGAEVDEVCGFESEDGEEYAQRGEAASAKQISQQQQYASRRAGSGGDEHGHGLATAFWGGGKAETRR